MLAWFNRTKTLSLIEMPVQDGSQHKFTDACSEKWIYGIPR